MNMMQRNELIAALETRGFTPGKPQDYGWTYTHKDGFKLEFDASGQFTLTLPSCIRRGVMEKPEDVLAIIDKAAEAL
jgi:hypothetical protein